MMFHIPDVLTADEVRQCREALERAAWVDGRSTAGHMAVRSKDNQQLAPDDPLAQQIGDFIVDRLGSHPQFIAAALPLKVLPPRFNRYSGGGTYGNHIDNAIFSVPGTHHRVRSDLSATLFFCDPDDYEGGELVVEDTYGSHRVKLPAGHLVLYPGSSLHRVEPVTRGARLAAFFWIQSLVREDNQRAMLLELDGAIQQLGQSVPEHPALVQLSGVYHNLLRHWSTT
ncbi:Fe2+-dependent dioxygenase [Pseudomonas sp. 1D4]|uniref:Fe2+-dependent dioxygenase n=2 Tax=Metapseudomonas otitidis TaxID=319939 RepID=A0A7X3H9H2_9GAMM|nr:MULTISPECIES: Fe2+-dependent dioxygenase [Pseudomonas]KIV70878.1 Iron-uptake factor PiuC [Pseudomonas sp. FeS53a]MBO2930982.1 Fe2+-dependent dioxygenase [Pseudomonas otitidis]MCO7554936.1 Fe2+-dependent dioxygenase [Pseudomonas otitidis]MDG9781715.1 Fe2+-dependent dioxygenase [Pseudomonas otitidis]MDH0339085.1 Fe2+-dependent dioxygenase [Pseudomonas otitidis]